MSLNLNKCLLVGFLWVISSQAISSKVSSSPYKVRLNDRGQFVDNFGRVTMYHGINSVMKGFPWFDHQILNDTRLKLYSEWGFNVVRLGTMWSGLQPTETSYNVTYIDILFQIIRKLKANGLYTLFDMHQDVLSSKFNSYDGIPLWLVLKFPNVSEEFQFPFPLSKNKTYFWAEYYISYATSDAFQNLYSTEIGLKNWENIWAKLASIFSKESSVIGYELLNEPWLGNFYTDPSRILPGFAGRHNLLPAYDRLVTKIRQFDNDTLVFYEPVTLGSYVQSVGNIGTGFDRVPGGVTQTSKSVLSYHFYCFLISMLNPSENYEPWKRNVCDNFFGKMLFESTADNIKVTGGGSFLTEFGGCVPDGNELSINTIECDAVLQLADSHYQSYTYWDSIFFNDDGSVKLSVVKTLARAYPRAVQGQPITYSFNRTNGVMNLIYVIDTDVKAPTEIFLPISVQYKTGFKNTTDPRMVTTFDSNNFLFSVMPTSDVKHGTQVRVTIAPV